MPTLSVIVPVYNTAAYLVRCLDSLLLQQRWSSDCPQLEVIVVNDGSTDGSDRICREYAERFVHNKSSRAYVRYINKENGGVSSARNAGIEVATGEWLSFVDSDDWVSPDYAETLFAHQPMADITFFGLTEHHTDKMGQEGERLVEPSLDYRTDRKGVEEVIYELRCGRLGDIFGWTVDKVMRTDLLRKHHIRFHEDIHFREDEIFTFEYCRYVQNIRVLPQKLYHYRILSTGLTSRGLRKTDLMPSALALEETLAYYSHPALCERILGSVTDYRAMHIYASPLTQTRRLLRDYRALVARHPQPGLTYKVNHLTHYLHRGAWAAWLYCLLRKL